jgi:LPXTG-motif cell wall-anchored protein
MMKRCAVLAAALMALSAGIALAAIPNTTDYLHQTTPMISGRVFSVDDRQIVVDTDQNQRVTLVMDSRTMLPVDLAPGMEMRAEFRVMENGQYYVSRIIPMRDGPATPKVAANENAGANPTDSALASTTAPQQRAATPREVVSEQAPMAHDAPAAAETARTLPQTASSRPLIAIAGVLALAGAGALMFKRRIARS